MKKLILIISMALACSIAFAQNSNDKILYLIDGIVSTKAAVDELPSETIKNVNVVKGVESVVVITTHAGREISGRVVDKDLKGDVVSVRGEKKPGSNALCLIKSANGDIKKVDNLESISPNDIKTMYVFKGEQGEQFKKYGETSNGVVLVELK